MPLLDIRSMRREPDIKTQAFGACLDWNTRRGDDFFSLEFSQPELEGRAPGSAPKVE